MDTVQSKLIHLRASLDQNCKDMSLVAELQNSIKDLQSIHNYPQNYTRLIFTIYDLSNHHNLIINNSNTSNQYLQLHPLSYRLKYQALNMICLILTMIKQKKMNFQKQRNLQNQAFQIMVLSIRLFLQSEQADSIPLGSIFQFQCFCDMLFQYIRYLPNIQNSTQAVYCLNKLDLMRINVNSDDFNLGDFVRSLHLWQKLPKDDKIMKDSYEYVRYIVSEVLLKILRKGQKLGSITSQLIQYLPQNYKQPIMKLLQGQPLSQQSARILGFDYQLYWQITNQGMQNINQQYLQNIITQMYQRNNTSVFQIAYLSKQPSLLLIWFNIANKNMKRSEIIQQAYNCFMCFLEEDESIYSRIQSDSKYRVLVELCKQVCLSIIRQPKNQPVNRQQILACITKLLINLISYKHTLNNKVLFQLFDNVYLSANKHNCLKICKTISSLQLYFQMLNRDIIPIKQQTYKKFMKHYSNDRSQMATLLKAAYQILNNQNHIIDDHTMQLLKTKPQFAILFLQQAQQLILLLDLPIQKFIKINNCIDIYNCMLTQFDELDDTNKLIMIAQHIQKLFISSSLLSISTNMDSINRLKDSCQNIISKTQRQIFCIIWLYLYCLSIDYALILNYQYGQSFNKYSKLLKMLSLVSCDRQCIEIMKVLICRSCTKFKKQMMQNCNNEISNSVISNEPGQIMFLKIIYEKISNNCQTDGSQDFIKFSMFQILCINSRQSQAQQFINSADIKLLKLYLASTFILKPIKRSILRKLFKFNLAQNTYPSVTLQDMRDLVQLAQSNSEARLYLQAIIDIFGQRGRKYLQILAGQNKRVQMLLISIQQNTY